MDRNRLTPGLALLLAIALGACEEPNASRESAGEPSPTAAANPDAVGASAVSGSQIPPDAARKMEQASVCNLEFLDGAPFDGADKVVQAPFMVRGWLGDPSGAAPVSPTLVLAAEQGAAEFRVAVQQSVARPDVVAAFPGNPGLAQSGFDAKVDPAAMAPGRYHLYLTYSIGDRFFVCDNGRYLRVPVK